MEHDSRLDRHAAVASTLGELTTEQLRDSLASASPLGAGIGGDAALMHVNGTAVFVKRVAVSDREQQPENLFATRNLFDLPPHCHYGVGAPPGTAWRELSAHRISTQWVMTGATDAFPLLHHWRLLGSDSPLTLNCAQHGDLDTWVAFWHGSDAVRERLEAQSAASTQLLLFLEYVPHNLLEWLTHRLADGPLAADAALDRVESQLLAGAAFMATNGLWHFDAHLQNILADDVQVYFSDFGLAASSSFDLSPSEETFLREHLEHDIAYVATQLVNWIVTNMTETARTWTHPRDRNAFVRSCAEGYGPRELPPSAARIVRDYAPIAAVMNDFYFALHGISRLTPYPATAVRSACASSGIGLFRDST